jgi:hypothetical protein
MEAGTNRTTILVLLLAMGAALAGCGGSRGAGDGGGGGTPDAAARADRSAAGGAGGAVDAAGGADAAASADAAGGAGGGVDAASGAGGGGGAPATDAASGGVDAAGGAAGSGGASAADAAGGPHDAAADDAGAERDAAAPPQDAAGADAGGDAGGGPSCTGALLRCNGKMIEACAGGGWIAVSTCACGCGADPATGVPLCTLRRCDGASVEDCAADGTWSHLQTCAYVCESGACSGQCVPGTQECDAVTQAPAVCNTRGFWDAQPACPFTCWQGACVGECKSGDSRCVGNSVQYCTLSSSPPYEGHWGAATACPYVCAGTTCGGSCKPGDTRCADVDHVQTCDGSGQWGTPAGCALGCFGNACVAAPPPSCSAPRARTTPIADDFESYAIGVLRDVSGDLWIPTQGTGDTTVSTQLYGLGDGLVMAFLDPVPFTSGVSYRSLGLSAGSPPAKVSIVLDNGVWAFPDSEYGVRFGLARVDAMFTITEALSVRIRNRAASVQFPFLAPLTSSVVLTNLLDYDMTAMTTFRAEIDFCARTLSLYSMRPGQPELLAGTATIPAGAVFDAFFVGATADFGTYVDDISVSVEE